MKVQVLADADAAARKAAEFIAARAREAVAARGRFVMAVSGGRTPWIMLRNLVGEDVPWAGLHVFQVDERVAPEGDADRNLTHLRECLSAAPIPGGHIHPMPVNAEDLDAGTTQYARELIAAAGQPPVLDLVHLGLGADGHTASLVPGDPVLDVTGADVALCGVYQGRRRMTLTFPAINRARCILWLVTGAEKAAMLKRLRDADASIPVGRVRQENAVVIADRAAVTGEDQIA